jgi:hypothetical protein
MTPAFRSRSALIVASHSYRSLPWRRAVLPVALCGLVLTAASAEAQDAAAPTAPVAAPVVAPPAAPVAVAPAAVAPVSTPVGAPPAAAPVAALGAPAQGAAAQGAPTEGAPAESAAPEHPGVTLALFADAYGTVQTSGSGTPATRSGHRAFAGQGPNRLAENGFSLSFVGLDATYDGGAFAATTSLRFGTSVPLFNTNNNAFGYDNITQGFVTWRSPVGLDLDFGMFTTIFGAEVAESWRNLNYTRGALYYYGQPFWHTGLRASYALTEQLTLKAMLVNGTNNISETEQNQGRDQSPTVAAQLGFTPNNDFSLLLGGMLATDADENDDGGFDTFLDLVATGHVGPLTLIFNSDYIRTVSELSDEPRNFFGASLAAGYALTPTFGLAGRAEFLLDDRSYDNTTNDWNLTTVTATFDYKPCANLIFRWDNRVETSNQDVFGNRYRQGPDDTNNSTFTNNWFESVVGVVVTSAP